jgi:hypothetical protein
MKQVIIVLLFISCVDSQDTILFDCCYNGQEKEILELINKDRVNKLVCDYDATLLAEERVIEITVDMSHKGFRSVKNYSTGEMLAYGFKDAKNTVKAFKNSESHCKLMLNESYNRIGIGIKDKYCAIILIK